MTWEKLDKIAEIVLRENLSTQVTIFQDKDEYEKTVAFLKSTTKSVATVYGSMSELKNSLAKITVNYARCTFYFINIEHYN